MPTVKEENENEEIKTDFSMYSEAEEDGKDESNNDSGASPLSRRGSK